MDDKSSFRTSAEVGNCTRSPFSGKVDYFRIGGDPPAIQESAFQWIENKRSSTAKEIRSFWKLGGLNLFSIVVVFSKSAKGSSRFRSFLFKK
jgi:hypothetical protein